jgi:hypothetical protein
VVGWSLLIDVLAGIADVMPEWPAKRTDDASASRRKQADKELNFEARMKHPLFRRSKTGSKHND